jgi:hypothetical protein
MDLGLFETHGVALPPRTMPLPAKSRTPERGRSLALEAGAAAEHLVCADLLIAGHRAFLAAQGMAYDVVVDHRDRLLRIQVKATSAAKNHQPGHRRCDGYYFHVRRAGRGNRRMYADDEFDIYALVALDIRRVGYVAVKEVGPRQLITFRVPGREPAIKPKTGNDFAERTFERAIAWVVK